MGEGNKYRPKRTGKGTPDAWRKRVGFESGSAAPENFVQSDKVEKKPKVIDLKSRRPVNAENLHSGSSFPKNGGENKNPLARQGNQNIAVDSEKEKKPMYRTGPTWETAERKPLDEISIEERIATLEDEIASDFGEAERRYINQWVDIYPIEFRKAIENREENGGKVTEKEIPAMRLSFINQIARWGKKRGIAPEKANILEKYLDLKLPVGIPEEKKENSEEIPGEEKETNFTPEQMAQIRVLLGIAVSRFREYYRESVQWGSESGGEVVKRRYILGQMKKGMENLIRSDQFLKDIFPEDKISKAVEKTMEFAEKFDITK